MRRLSHALFFFGEAFFLLWVVVASITLMFVLVRPRRHPCARRSQLRLRMAS